MNAQTITKRALSLLLALTLVLSVFSGVTLDIPARAVDTPAVLAEATADEPIEGFLIKMTDSWGDGWNGCGIKIYEDDTFVTTATVASGSSSQVPLPYTQGKIYAFLWSKGSYAAECSFEIWLNGKLLVQGCGSDYADGDLIYCDNGCSHVYDGTAITPPTCTEEGFTTYTCVLCGWSYIGDKVPTVEHSFENNACSQCGKSVFDYETSYDGTCVITAYNGNSANLTIPSQIDGYNVTGIDSLAFDDHYELVGVTIPEGVTSIGGRAFEYCTSLVSVTLPESLSRIEHGAFRGCYDLTELSIPQGIDFVGDGAFEYCGELDCAVYDSGRYFGNRENPYLVLLEPTAYDITQLKLHPDIKLISDAALYSCDSLEYNLYENCKYLGSQENPYMFLMDTIAEDMTDIVIHPKTNVINCFAFRFCSSLISVTIPGGVVGIGEEAFSGCTELETITFQGSAPEIGKDAFSRVYSAIAYYPLDDPSWTKDVKKSYGGSISWSRVGPAECPEDYQYEVRADGTCAITSYIGSDSEVIVPAQIDGYPVMRIADEAFSYKGNLTSVTISEGVISLGASVFYECDNLTTVTLPSTLIHIQNDAFSGSEGPMNIHVSENNPAYSSDSNGVLFNKNKTNIIFVPKSISGNYVIPNGVTSIGDRAFSGCHSLSGVTIPRTVRTIGEHAFYECIGLTSVTIPEGVTGIGKEAFAYCGNLADLTISGSVTSIGEDAFYGCDDLSGLQVSESNAIYASDSKGVLFDKKNTSLLLAPRGISGNYVIPNGVTTIAESAFYDCTELTGVTIPESVTTIGDYAFYNSGITEVTIPAGVTNMGRNAFSYCESLTGVTISKGVTSVSKNAFSYCENLASVSIPEGVTSIVYGAFNGCSALTGVALPESLTSIGDYAFSASGLTEVTVPDRVASIGEGAFKRCRALTNAKLSESVLTIGKNAFFSTGLTEIVIPEKVTSIGYAAFSNCSNLEKAVINGCLTGIEDYTFSDCTNLTSVTIPESLCWIGRYVFDYCPNLQYNIYEGGKYLGNEQNPYVALMGVTSSDITSISFAPQMKITGAYALANCSELTALELPEGFIGIGEKTFNGCSSLTAVALPQSVRYIGEGAFQDCSSLTGITIPDGVTAIESYTFYQCSSLTDITLPESICNIGYRAFQGCSSLTGIIIPEGVTEISDCAFYGCSGLSNVVISEKATRIGGWAFYGCSSLTSVLIPNGVTGIEQGAFYGCSGLTSLTIPGSVQSIGAMDEWDFGDGSDSTIFGGCSNLESITFQEGVTAIGTDVIYSDRLTSVSLPESLTCIYPRAFSGCSNLEYTIYEGGKYLGNAENPYVAIMGLADEEITELVIHPETKVIAESAFEDCTNLVEVTIPGGVTRIPDRAFSGCSSLVTANIMDGVQRIEYEAFSGCSNLTTVNIPQSIDVIWSYAFDGCDKLEYRVYDNAKYWGDESNPYRVLMGPVSMEITQCTIHENTEVIAGAAFRSCASLKNIVIPANVTYLGDRAFSFCVSLESIELLGQITRLEEYTFNDCVSLKSIRIPDSVTFIGQRAFAWCTGMESIVVSENLTVIDEEAFYNAEGLKEIVIPATVKKIGAWAFATCDGLRTVRFCGDAPDMGSVFTGGYFYMSGNTTIYYPSNNPTWTPEVMKKCAYDNRIYTWKAYDLPTDGITVSGTLTSLSDTNLTVELWKEGAQQASYSAVITDGSYSFKNVPVGNYILKVSADQCVAREYMVVAGYQALELDVKICRIGDINGDGKINVADTSKAYGHVKGGAQLTDYSFVCGDVDGNGKINVADISKIYAHIKGTKPLW